MDLDNIIEINNMLDVYGKLLTQKQLKVMKYYYEENFSLSEIAEKLGITRQAVNFSIKQSLESMGDLEKKLHLVEIKKILLNASDSKLKTDILSKLED